MCEELKYKLNKQENYETKNEWVEMSIEKLMNYFKNLTYDEEQEAYIKLRKRMMKKEQFLKMKAKKE